MLERRKGYVKQMIYDIWTKSKNILPLELKNIRQICTNVLYFLFRYVEKVQKIIRSSHQDI